MSTQILLKVPSLLQRARWTRCRPEEPQARSLRGLREHAYARPFTGGSTKVVLSGVREDLADTALCESLRRELKAQGTIVPPLEVRRVLAMLRTTVGKTLLIESNVTDRAEKEH